METQLELQLPYANTINLLDEYHNRSQLHDLYMYIGVCVHTN